MNIFVIAIIGIAIFSVVIFDIFMTGEEPLIQFPRPEHYEIEITGLKDTYLIGEPYSFSYILSGFGSSCGENLITFPINKTDNMTVGQSPSCAKSFPIDFVLDIREVYGKRYGNVALQETGNYTVTVWFEKGDNGPTIAHKSFLVIEGECDEKNTRENVSCFVDAFRSCMETKINQVMYTVEGDPILLTALIKRENETCNIQVIVDTKYDKFGLPAIYQSICNNAEMQEEYWIINQCKNDEEYSIRYDEQDWEKNQNLFSGPSFSNILEIPVPKISQTEAIKIIENDLKNRESNSTKILKIVDIIGDRDRYVPFSEFQTNNGIVPLVFVSKNDTLLTINNASLRINYLCNMGTIAYCGYMPPFNLDYKHRLVYGFDIVYGADDANMEPSFYAVDAVSGDIVDSGFLRNEAREK